MSGHQNTSDCDGQSPVNSTQQTNGVTSGGVCCRMCGLSDRKDLLFNPCRCVGQSEFIHRRCLSVWFRRARYDVLCCDCRLRYTRIKYRKAGSFFNWLGEDRRVRNHVLIGCFIFPILLSVVCFGIVQAASPDTSDIYKVLLVPTIVFGILTLWKLIGSAAVLVFEYRAWRSSRVNAECRHQHSK